jgi:hypothetical protein
MKALVCIANIDEINKDAEIRMQVNGYLPSRLMTQSSKKDEAGGIVAVPACFCLRSAG